MIMRRQWEPSRRSCVGQESSYASWLLSEASSELLVRAGVLPAQGRFHSIESALNGRG